MDEKGTLLRDGIERARERNDKGRRRNCIDMGERERDYQSLQARCEHTLSTDTLDGGGVTPTMDSISIHRQKMEEGTRERHYIYTQCRSDG